MELVKRFSRVFRESGLSQAEFGNRIGQKQHAVSQVLSGAREPSKPMLRAIITNFDISAAWLFDGEGEPYKKAQDAAAGGQPPYPTREEFWKVVGRLEKLEAAFEKMGEGFRRHLEKEPEEAHPQEPA